jgi:DMSO/TMAO reductase YedYZ molybdopterin-dependent catalytic subunit
MQTTPATLDRDDRAHDAILQVTGDVERPLALGLADLQQFESRVAAPFELRCFTTQRFIRRIGAYRGVRLTDLIERAGLSNPSSTDFKQTVFIAIAHDGYAVVFSWHELFNTPVGDGVLVAYECDGRTLDGADGGPILYSGADRDSATRHVKRLARIVVRVLAP